MNLVFDVLVQFEATRLSITDTTSDRIRNSVELDLISIKNIPKLEENQNDFSQKMVDKATLVISFPEKETPDKRLEIVPHENTVADVAEVLQDAFQCGEDWVCVLIKPSEDKYLPGNLTIEELNIHTGGIQAMGLS